MSSLFLIFYFIFISIFCDCICSYYFSIFFYQPAGDNQQQPKDMSFEDLYIPPQPQGYADWQHYDGVYASVYYTPQDRATALHLSQLASKALPQIANMLGVSTGGHVEIYIAPTQESFGHAASNFDWADGTAWPKSGLIFYVLRKFDLVCLLL